MSSQRLYRGAVRRDRFLPSEPLKLLLEEHCVILLLDPFLLSDSSPEGHKRKIRPTLLVRRRCRNDAYLNAPSSLLVRSKMNSMHHSQAILHFSQKTSLNRHCGENDPCPSHFPLKRDMVGIIPATKYGQLCLRLGTSSEEDESHTQSRPLEY